LRYVLQIGEEELSAFGFPKDAFLNLRQLCFRHKLMVSLKRRKG